MSLRPYQQHPDQNNPDLRQCHASQFTRHWTTHFALVLDRRRDECTCKFSNPLSTQVPGHSMPFGTTTILTLDSNHDRVALTVQAKRLCRRGLEFFELHCVSGRVREYDLQIFAEGASAGKTSRAIFSFIPSSENTSSFMSRLVSHQFENCGLSMSKGPHPP